MMDCPKLPDSVSFQPSRHETQDILQVNYPLMILDIIYLLLPTGVPSELQMISSRS